MKIIFTICFSILLSFPLFSQEKINWMTFEQAVEKNKIQKKKFLVDVYTNWCGWCKRMDASTFQNPFIVEYVNQNFHAVKLDAEMSDTVRLGEQVFVNENADKRRSAHQLAIALLNGKMSYPTIVYLDEDANMLSPVPGYMDAESIEPVIKYYGDNAYKTTTWEEYQKSFKGVCKQN